MEKGVLLVIKIAGKYVQIVENILAEDAEKLEEEKNKSPAILAYIVKRLQVDGRPPILHLVGPIIK